MKPLEITADQFESEVISADLPVLMDFWGPSCQPCLALSPLVDSLAREYAGRIKVVKVNSAENRRLCLRLRVMGLPTFLVYSEGHEIERISGDVAGDQLQTLVEKVLI